MSNIVEEYAWTRQYNYYIFVAGCLIIQLILVIIVAKFGIIKQLQQIRWTFRKMVQQGLQ